MIESRRKKSNKISLVLFYCKLKKKESEMSVSNFVETNNLNLKPIPPNTNIDDVNETKIDQNELEIKDLIKHLRNETIKLFIKLFQTKNNLLKFYLTLLLLSVTAITCYMLVGLFLSYLAYEVLTTSQIIAETPAIFPRVNICNYINFQTEYAIQFLSDISKELNPNVNIFQVNTNGINLTYDQLNNLTQSIYVRAINKMNSKDFTDQQRRALEHDVGDILFDCKFGNSPCSISSDFVWTYDKTFGNCYSFNSNLTSSQADTKKSDIAGNSFGLNIKVYVNFHENLTLFHSFTSAKGVILMVDNNSILFDRSLTDGFLRVEPGSVTSVKVDRTFMFELPKPYSTCDIPNGVYSEYYLR